MVDNERLAAFLHSFDHTLPPLLNQLEQEAKEDNVPIIRPQMQSLLRFLMTSIQPKRILEVGTAVGFSALFMSTFTPKNCHITTIERYDKYIAKAKEHFELAGKMEEITLLEGDAAEVLKHLTENESYDFIFMDAAKGQYIHFLPDILRLLKPKGLLVSDKKRRRSGLRRGFFSCKIGEIDKQDVSLIFLQFLRGMKYDKDK
ncbi:MAG: O-methyltransferase [Lachnospiraceae bacterium]|nr:O-methyltransferase [Lachnospiraceae bacterium]